MPYDNNQLLFDLNYMNGYPLQNTKVLTWIFLELQSYVTFRLATYICFSQSAVSAQRTNLSFDSVKVQEASVIGLILRTKKKLTEPE